MTRRMPIPADRSINGFPSTQSYFAQLSIDLEAQN